MNAAGKTIHSLIYPQTLMQENYCQENLECKYLIYAGISHNSATPEYDPYDLDIKLKDKLRDSPKDIQDSIRRDAVDATTIKTLTLTNVRKLKLDNKKPQTLGYFES